ncbi:unnamed protein product, partial [Allacma fusca]
MGERIVEGASKHLPVTIVRPGAISSSMTEPLPGWNETQSSTSKWAKLMFSGAYHTVLVNRQGNFDLIPVDYTANACLAAAWRLGTTIKKEFRVYNCVPNHMTNPIMFRNLIKWGYETLFVANNYLFRKIPGKFRSLLKCGSDEIFQQEYNLAQLLATSFKLAATEQWEFSTYNMKEIDWKLFARKFAQGLYSYDKHLIDSLPSVGLQNVQNEKNERVSPSK